MAFLIRCQLPFYARFRPRLGKARLAFLMAAAKPYFIGREAYIVSLAVLLNAHLLTQQGSILYIPSRGKMMPIR